MKFEFNCLSGFWGNYVLMCWWDSNMSDLGWKVKGQPWPLKLIYSHFLIRFNISSENNDFGFNSIQENQFFKKKKILFKCIRKQIWPPVKYFTDSSKAVLLLWIFYVFVLSCVCYVFVHVCLYVLCGHLLGKGWPLGSRLWCLLWVCHFPIGILGQVWYLIVSIPDLCTLTYLMLSRSRST